jgi:hypothetical protein
MSAEQKTPADIARGLAKRARTQSASREGTWRETYTLKRGEARVKALCLHSAKRLNGRIGGRE